MELSVKSEPLIHPKMILAGVVAISCVIYFYADWAHLPWNDVNTTITYTLLITVSAIACWLLLEHRPLAFRWFTILLLSITIHAWGIFFKLPETLTLAAVTVVFAVPILGISQAIYVAIGESICVTVLAAQLTGKPNIAISIIALIIIWGNYLAMLATNQYVHQMSGWFSEYFNRARTLLEEAREHRAELLQAMGDMAHLNQQLAMLNKRVNDLRVIAEEAQKSKTKFVARVSHEFRTPLNMIIGLVDLITEKPEIYDATLSPRMRDVLRTVHRNCSHLADMVNDVLDLSRIETERMVLNKERVDLHAIVDAAVDTVHPLLESKNIDIEIQIAADLPLVYCDRTRIEQVILNLISNSARYTAKGFIRVTALERAQYVQVSVQDTGAGISKEDLTRIFEPFSQGTSDFGNKKGGSGLGLSISKQFIELHHGRMWVDSEVGMGSTFTFELPVSSPLDPISRPGHHITESWIWRERHRKKSSANPNYNPRILVHDTTGDLCSLLSRHSGELEIVNTMGVPQILDALRNAPAHAVLLNTPSMERLMPLIEALRQETNHIPVIGCSIPRSLDHAKSLGLLGQLIKPVSRADLQRALEACGQPVRSVLLADDDPDVIDLFRQMLLVCDPTLAIATASNGSEALDLLRAQTPDLLLLDLVMPGVNGWQVLETMATDASVPMVPTYFVSAQDPYDQPPHSDFLYVAIEDGLSVNQILRCSLELSDLLLQPEVVPDPEPR